MPPSAEQPRLARCGSPSELAATAAALFCERLQASARAGRSFVVALPGGRITKLFLEQVTAQIRTHALSTAPLRLFWGDERCVPSDSPDSNYRLAYECLIEPCRISPVQVCRTQGELEPAAACGALAASLAAMSPAASSGNASLPVLDLVLLGMGEDGHVASLFPETMAADLLRSQWCFPVVASKPPPRRITFGYPLIAAAREVWILASGAGKEAALARSLGTGDTPLGEVLRLRHAATMLFTDLRVDVGDENTCP